MHFDNHLNTKCYVVFAATSRHTSADVDNSVAISDFLMVSGALLPWELACDRRMLGSEVAMVFQEGKLCSLKNQDEVNMSPLFRSTCH